MSLGLCVVSRANTGEVHMIHDYRGFKVPTEYLPFIRATIEALNPEIGKLTDAEFEEVRKKVESDMAKGRLPEWKHD